MNKSAINCRVLIIFPFILFLSLLSCKPKPADLIIRSAKVVTVDETFSIYESVAIRDSQFIAVGTNEEIDKFTGPETQILELNGAMVLPGLVDAYGHLHSLGDQLANLNISNTKSFKELSSIVAARAKFSRPGDWIIGGRWDHTNWKDNEFPVHDDLSLLTPNNPVYLTRIDGNSVLVNAKALELAGISKDTPDPVGGKIIRKANGDPSGVLINEAMNLVSDKIPELTYQEKQERLRKAVKHCNQYGLTSVHEAGIGPEEIAMYKEMIAQNNLDIRLYAMLGKQEEQVLDIDLEPYFNENRLENYWNYMLEVKSIKLFFDGALGSRGAAFFEPYSDDPDNFGLLRITPEYITKVSLAALATGMGVNTHCIGIKANRLCLDAYETAFQKYPDVDHRFHIDHAQVVELQDIERFGKLGVIPSMQPTHCISDMHFVDDRIGEERSKYAYAWRTFIDEGCIIPCGSDFPVESVNPLHGIYAAITRQDKTGNPEGGWHPEQRMTIEEAIKGFTIWAAKAAWQENVLGSIEAGKLADLTILDKDLLTISPQEILTTKVLATIVGGQIKYSSTK